MLCTPLLVLAIFANLLKALGLSFSYMFVVVFLFNIFAASAVVWGSLL